MILGIGTDIVQVKRFESWNNFSHSKFRRVFSEKELAQSSLGGSYDSSSLAARFAAKEAAFKAMSASLVKLNIVDKEFSLLFLCKCVEVVKGKWDVPKLSIDWRSIEEKIGKKLPKLDVELSISHEKDYALAFVIINKG